MSKVISSLLFRLSGPARINLMTFKYATKLPYQTKSNSEVKSFFAKFRSSLILLFKSKNIRGRGVAQWLVNLLGVPKVCSSNPVMGGIEKEGSLFLCCLDLDMKIAIIHLEDIIFLINTPLF